MEYVEVKQLIPNELLICRELRYAKEYFKTQKDVSDYLLDLHKAYVDCKNKIFVIRKLQNDTED